VLQRISGPRREEVMGEWRNLHNEELVLFAKYNWNNQVKKNEIGKACSTNGEKRNATKILVAKPHH
jgi:hypothetical protein